MIESLWSQFAIETSEHLEAIEPLLLAAEEGVAPGTEEVAALFRSFHSIKGLSRAMDMHGMEAIAHRAEDLLGQVRSEVIPLAPDLASLLLKSLDAIQDLRGDAVAHRLDREPPQEVVDRLQSVFDQSKSPTSPVTEKLGVATVPTPMPASATNTPPLHDDPEMLGFFIDMMRGELPRLAEALTEAFHTNPELHQGVMDSLDALSTASETMGFHNLLEVLGRLTAAMPTDWPIVPDQKETLVRLLSDLRNMAGEIERSTSQDSGSGSLTAVLGEVLHDEIYYLIGQVFQTLEHLIAEDRDTADISDEEVAGRIAGLCSLIHAYLAFHACEAECYLLLMLVDVYHRVSDGQLIVQREMVDLTLEAVRQLQKSRCTTRDGATVADAEAAERLVNRIRQFLMFSSVGMQDSNLQAMFREFIDRVAIKPELVEIMTPENMGELMLAIQEGHQPFEIDADLEADPQVMMGFMTWLQENGRSITNRTVEMNGRNAFEFLVASQRHLPDIQKALREIDPGGTLLQARSCPLKEIPREEQVERATTRPRPMEGEERGTGRDQSSQTIRVEGPVLDAFMNQIGEMVMVRGQLQHALQDDQVKGAVAGIKTVAEQLRGTDTRQNLLLNDILQRLEVIEEQQRRLQMAEGHLQGVLVHLQEKVMELRVVPIDTVFKRFPRVVRDLAQKMDKQVRLRITGQDVRIDKGMVDALMDPLMHMVRNSLDHGLETPADRQRVGKHPQGVLELGATQSGSQVVVEIQDDGRGLNIDRIRAKAITNGVVTPEENRRMDDQEAIQLIFQPGFSTAEQVTETSGRGVGMDVVNTTVNRMGGSIKVTSSQGKGTTVTLRLPLSAAIQNTLLVEMGGQTVAIPDRYVGEILEVTPEELQVVKGFTAILLRNVFLPVVHLGELLGIPVTPPTGGESLPVVVLSNGKNRLGVAVDRLHRRQELFLKEVHPRMATLPGVGGASILGNGRVVLILEGEELFQLAKRQGGSLLAAWAIRYRQRQPAKVSA